jgi:hypothetical protein
VLLWSRAVLTCKSIRYFSVDASCVTHRKSWSMMEACRQTAAGTISLGPCQPSPLCETTSSLEKDLLFDSCDAVRDHIPRRSSPL